jgi:hypothetical protein
MAFGIRPSILLRAARVCGCAGIVLWTDTLLGNARQPGMFNVEPRVHLASTSQPAEADGIALWLNGQKDAAVEAFLQADWNNGGFIAGDPTLSLTEAQFEAKQSNDPAIKTDLLDKVTAFKHLVAEVLRRSDTAQNAGDIETTRHDLLVVNQCGIYLTSREDGLTLLKFVGKTLMKIASDRLAKLPTPSN